jgi:hypothetical protein
MIIVILRATFGRKICANSVQCQVLVQKLCKPKNQAGICAKSVQGILAGRAAGTAGKFQRNLFKADSQQGGITFLPASMRQFFDENSANAG